MKFSNVGLVLVFLLWLLIAFFPKSVWVDRSEIVRHVIEYGEYEIHQYNTIHGRGIIPIGEAVRYKMIAEKDEKIKILLVCVLINGPGKEEIQVYELAEWQVPEYYR